MAPVTGSHDNTTRSANAPAVAVTPVGACMRRNPASPALDAEIATKLGIDEEELQKWLSDVAAGSVGPLDHVVADNTATDTHSSMHRDTSPDAVIEADELRKVMRQEMKKLPERERTVLVLYYEENLTLGEIGDVLGVTESRVSQIHTKAVLQMRARLRAADVG